MKRFVYMICFLLNILASCSQADGLHNKVLEKSICAALEKDSVKEINLNPLIDFAWDKAYIFTPYTTQETIYKQLGVKFKDPSNIHFRDDINLIVFLNKNKVVQYVEIPRKYGDL
ncbi:hypothetical protein, partial [Neobacillus drentensis]|uniref:hypothetical protein n=1 Tax=Neobacillus drentensis TaxID=220684 RepID=UPI0030017E03